MYIYIYIYIYISTGYAKPRHRAYNHILTCSLDMFLRTLKHYGSILVRFVALISRAVFDHKTWIWDHLGSILVTWGSILVSFWRPWPPLEPSWATLGESVEKGTIFPQKVRPFWAPFWHQNLKKCKKLKKTVSGNECRKYVLPEPIPNGKMLIFYCKYHMFWEVAHHPFRWLLVSFWLPFGVTFWHFCKKWCFGTSKRHTRKLHQQLMNKSHASIPGGGLKQP